MNLLLGVYTRTDRGGYRPLINLRLLWLCDNTPYCLPAVYHSVPSVDTWTTLSDHYHVIDLLFQRDFLTSVPSTSVIGRTTKESSVAGLTSLSEGT